ncbi:MAG: PGPGW domain-containing protein [Verrucomicrobiae bacterium]|nr:PGPGW domain-containing protein [Verrucomicrobiae bacterium]
MNSSSNSPKRRTLKVWWKSVYESEPVKWIRRLIILVVGGTVLLIGVALIILPGPAFVVIPLGLAILAVEFTWARRWLHKAREMVKNRLSKKESYSRL